MITDFDHVYLTPALPGSPTYKVPSNRPVVRLTRGDHPSFHTPEDLMERSCEACEVLGVDDSWKVVWAMTKDYRWVGVKLLSITDHSF